MTDKDPRTGQFVKKPPVSSDNGAIRVNSPSKVPRPKPTLPGTVPAGAPVGSPPPTLPL